MEKAKAKAKFNVEKAKAKLQEVLNAESDHTCKSTGAKVPTQVPLSTIAILQMSKI